MTKESKSTLKAKKIEKYIRKKYTPIEYKVIFHDRNETVNIQIETESKRDGFKVTTPITFDEKDILEIADKILRKKGIKYYHPKIFISHIDGESFEPMDYGSSEFSGVTFNWDDK